MAGNFKPEFWSDYCQTELEKDLVLSNWCDYTFEGEIQKGAKLKIVGANRPAVKDYVEGTPITVENLADNAQYLEITQQKYFAFYVKDIAKAQSKKGYLETQFDEAKKSLAEEADKFIGTFAKNALTKMTSNSTDISAETDKLATLDAALVALYENDVNSKTELAADLNAEHITGIRKQLASLFTDNVDYIKNGAVGKYNNTYLRMSNNLYNNGTDDYEMVRTKKAIAFAGQIDSLETCRDTYGFSDIVKGLHTYGGKLVRPKELYVIKAH